MTAIETRNFEKSTDYILPEFFDIIPKSQLVKMMEMTFNNPSMVFELKNPKVLSVEDAKKVQEKYYSLLTYSNQMNVRMLNEEEQPETEDEKKMRMSLIQLSLEKTFGSENVKYNKETDFFEILVEKQVYAISKNGKNDWKFLVLDKEQKMILSKLLPKDLLDKI
ncbi:MAG: hypothetical protein EOO46_10675 [Flavobacterium sp.]|nr:MAG: hypothetical protein EOO46_10675 [Flavobacterium sp.]